MGDFADRDDACHLICATSKILSDANILCGLPLWKQTGRLCVAARDHVCTWNVCERLAHDNPSCWWLWVRSLMGHLFFPFTTLGAGERRWTG